MTHKELITGVMKSNGEIGPHKAWLIQIIHGLEEQSKKFAIDIITEVYDIIHSEDISVADAMHRIEGLALTFLDELEGRKQ